MKMSSQLYIKAQIVEELEVLSEEHETNADVLTDRVSQYKQNKLSSEDAENFDLDEIRNQAKFDYDFVKVIDRLLDFINTMDLDRD